MPNSRRAVKPQRRTDRRRPPLTDRPWQPVTSHLRADHIRVLSAPPGRRRQTDRGSEVRSAPGSAVGGRAVPRRRISTWASAVLTVLLALMALCIPATSASATAAAAAAPGARPAHVASAPAVAAASVPAAPFVRGAEPRGLGLLVAWEPNAAADAVTGYTVTVRPASGGPTPPAGCGAVTRTAAASDSAALVPGLCVGVAYVATVTAQNATGTSPAGPATAPAVPCLPGRRMLRSSRRLHRARPRCS